MWGFAPTPHHPLKRVDPNFICLRRKVLENLEKSMFFVYNKVLVKKLVVIPLY